jgi:hypothetical protein
MECKFCHERLDKLPPEANLFPHRIGLCTPSRREVELTIESLEIEDEREKEALRKFWERERQKTVLGKTGLRLAIVACAVAAGLLGWAIFG